MDQGVLLAAARFRAALQHLQEELARVGALPDIYDLMDRRDVGTWVPRVPTPEAVRLLREIEWALLRDGQGEAVFPLGFHELSGPSSAASEELRSRLLEALEKLKTSSDSPRLDSLHRRVEEAEPLLTADPRVTIEWLGGLAGRIVGELEYFDSVRDGLAMGTFAAEMVEPVDPVGFVNDLPGAPSDLEWPLIEDRLRALERRFAQPGADVVPSELDSALRDQAPFLSEVHRAVFVRLLSQPAFKLTAKVEQEAQAGDESPEILAILVGLPLAAVLGLLRFIGPIGWLVLVLLFVSMFTDC